MSTDDLSNSRVETTGIERSISSEEDVVVAILETVAEAAGTTISELSPLYRILDGDALNALFPSNGTAAEAAVEFVYHGYRVRYRSDRMLLVAPIDTETAV